MKHLWALIQSAEYREEYERVPSKYRNQISRKTHELMSGPAPGGSRTSLKGYDRLCRMRSGDFRIIYAYDERVVQLMSLRRRDERTYDNLDDMEIQQFEGFRAISGAKDPKYEIPSWKAAAEKWEPPKPKEVEPLPQPITAAMLEQLGIPAEFRPALLDVKSVDDLLDCQGASFESIVQVLDCICPKSNDTPSKRPTPVVVLGDLVDQSAAEVGGPIDASSREELQRVDERACSLDEGMGTMKSEDPARHLPPVPLVVLSTRKLEPMKTYQGNTSKGISKDSRYTVKHDGKVALLYYLDDKEKTLLTTDVHPELVALVNEAKRSGGSTQGGGSFLINEYRHVLVPNIAGDAVLYAGVYTRDLEFKFEETLISPVAPSRIRPGDVWPGPHAGIRYTLAAGATDIRYELKTDRGTTRTVSITDFHSAGELASLLDMCRAVKPGGGAIYVNEARELFAPVDDGTGYQRRYIGHLGNKPWFPEPA